MPRSEYFYELCFCLLTPQSKAENAEKVIQKLKTLDFFNSPFDATEILRLPENYIRFHSTKAKRLLLLQSEWSKIDEIFDLVQTGEEKREFLVQNINGIGWKEASHFLRNIGQRNLAILDRHILKHLVSCAVFSEVPNISTKSRYLEVGKAFKIFADEVKIPIDELDLLFWSFETGKILK